MGGFLSQAAVSDKTAAHLSDRSHQGWHGTPNSTPLPLRKAARSACLSPPARSPRLNCRPGSARVKPLSRMAVLSFSCSAPDAVADGCGRQSRLPVICAACWRWASCAFSVRITRATMLFCCGVVRCGAARDHRGRGGDPFGNRSLGGADCVGRARPGCQPMMFPLNRVRIMVATKPVDFRKGHDGLAALLSSVRRKDPFTGTGTGTGTVFVFRSRRADRLKLL